MEQKKSIWQLLKTTVMQWFEDQPFQLSSSLAYYTLFSLAPLLIIVIAIAGLVFGREAAQQQIVGTLQGMIGEQSAEAVQGMIQNASSQPKTGMISAAIGLITLILGAAGAAGSLITVLVWVYYSGLIFFLGAEFTQVYATQYGSGVAPAENAEPIDPQKRQTPPPEKRTSGHRGGPTQRNRSSRVGSR